MKYNRGNLIETVHAARDLARKTGITRYVFSTYYGHTIGTSQPSFQSYIIVPAHGPSVTVSNVLQQSTLSSQAAQG
jgi:hypothetical protein